MIVNFIVTAVMINATSGTAGGAMYPSQRRSAFILKDSGRKCHCCWQNRVWQSWRKLTQLTEANRVEMRENTWLTLQTSAWGWVFQFSFRVTDPVWCLMVPVLNCSYRSRTSRHKPVRTETTPLRLLSGSLCVSLANVSRLSANCSLPKALR